MTNRIATVLAVIAIAALLADFWWAGGAASLFLAKKFADLIEYLAFWR